MMSLVTVKNIFTWANYSYFADIFQAKKNPA